MLRDLWSELRYRLRSLFRRATVERELDDELRFHLERQAEQYRRAGMNPDEAMRRARLAFGGVQQIKEETRDVRGFRQFEHFFRDLGLSLRIVRSQPGFAALVVLSLALGLGATTAVFSITYRVLFASLPVARPDQLIMLERVSAERRANTFSWADYRALRSASGVGELAGLRSGSAIAVAADSTSTVWVNLSFVEGSFFQLLGLRPSRGRLLSPGDDAARAAVAVLSEPFAGQLFGPGTNPIGRTIPIGGAPFVVVGTTPGSYRGLYFPGDFTVAIPLGAVPLLAQGGPGRDDYGQPYGLRDDRETDRAAFMIIGRRRSALPATRSALGSVFAACCARRDGGSVERLEVVDIRQGIIGKDNFRRVARSILVILLGGMGLVLVVVCCNLASLLLVRASARRREIAVRLALGASRKRLVSQLVTENLPLALLAGILAVPLALWATVALVRALPPDWGERVEPLRFQASPMVLLFVAAATLACGLAFAVYPALRATRSRLAEHLRLDARASRSRGQGTIARGAVVVQLAVTVVLVTVASLFASTLGNLSRADAGFATDQMLLLGLETRSTRYEQTGLAPRFEEILQRVRAVPGVRAVAPATMVPLFGGSNSWDEIVVPGYAPPDGKPLEVHYVAVGPGYFRTTGIRLLAGREFAPGDRSGSGSVAIVNAEFARRYCNGATPLGRSFGVGTGGPGMPQVQIVGMADDARYEDLRSAAVPELYYPLAQLNERLVTLQLVARTEQEPLGMARAVTGAIVAAAPGLQVRRVRDMRGQRDEVTTVERISSHLAFFMSVLALVLSAVGLFGVVSYGVVRRTAEIGVRLALGARTQTVLWLVGKETLALLSIGILLGVPLSFAASSAIRSQLFGVSSRDPSAMLLAILVLASVGVIASLVPARHAARIDPKIALNAD